MVVSLKNPLKVKIKTSVRIPPLNEIAHKYTKI